MFRVNGTSWAQGCAGTMLVKLMRYPFIVNCRGRMPLSDYVQDEPVSFCSCKTDTSAIPSGRTPWAQGRIKLLKIRHSPHPCGSMRRKGVGKISAVYCIGSPGLLPLRIRCVVTHFKTVSSLAANLGLLQIYLTCVVRLCGNL